MIGWIVGVGLLIAGGYLVVSAGRAAGGISAQAHGWLPARGIVVGHERPGEPASQTAHPIVRYLGPDGREHRFTGDYAVDLGACPVGHRVDILVDPRRPERARLVTDHGTGTAGPVRRGIGALLIVVGLVTLVGATLFATR